VEAHASLPDLEDGQGVAEVGSQVIEQDVAQARTQDQPKHAPGDEVVHHGRGPAGAGLCRPDAGQHPARREAEEVHQSIPAHLKRAEGQGNGIEVGVHYHEGSVEMPVVAAFKVRKTGQRANPLAL